MSQLGERLRNNHCNNLASRLECTRHFTWGKDVLDLLVVVPSFHPDNSLLYGGIHGVLVRVVEFDVFVGVCTLMHYDTPISFYKI